MSGMTMSATQRKHEQQTGTVRERWHHKPTGKRYVLTLEVAGACYMEGMDMRTIEVSRNSLDDNEVWERIP